MRKTLFLLIGLLVAGGAAYWATQKKQQKGSLDRPDMNFAINKPEEIAKIFLADRNNQTVTLERKDGVWRYNGQYKARPSAIQTLLSTMSKVQVWYIPPKVAEENMVKSLGAEGIKVEAYDAQGKLLKAYYVGGVTNDEMGTFMIMEGANQPYVTHIPGFTGQLRVRYLLGEELWRDRTVFSVQPENIQSVTVEYPQQRSASFRLHKEQPGQYAVSPFYNTTPAIKQPLRKGTPEGYLLQFEQLSAEGIESDYAQRDSIRALVPFAIVTLTQADGQVQKATFWPMEMQYDQSKQSEQAARFFTDLNGTDLFLTQQRVFGPIFRRYDYFFLGKEMTNQ